MQKLNKHLIKDNILKLIYYSGITDIAFANLIGISDKQIKRIKKGSAEFSIDDINKSSDFFKIKLENINNKEIELERDFRDQLVAKNSGDSEYEPILLGNPPINYAIEFALLDNLKFRNTGLDVSEIREIFRLRNWDYTSAYISLAMSRNKSTISVFPHPTKMGRNIYTYKK